MLILRGIFHGLLLVFLLFIAQGMAKDTGAARDLAKGLEYAESGRLDQAIELWTRVVQRNAKSYTAYVNRGRAYLMSGAVFNAIKDWHKARELSPLFAYGVYVGPFIREAPGDGAILNYVVPLELDPDHIASVLMTGALLLDIGQTEKAVELFRKSIDLTRNPLLKNQLEYWINSIENTPKP